VKKADVKNLLEERFVNFYEHTGVLVFLRQMPHYLNNNIDIKSLYRFVAKYLQREELRYIK